MAGNLSVVAIIAAYNEADIIDAVVRDLIAQDISVYFIDDGSTDGTVQAVEPYTGRGVIAIERRRHDRAESGSFRWEEILRRKAALAGELDADWFIHHDADEIRESPWADVPLKEAIGRVDALGFNAIDFENLDFRPTDEGFRAGDDVRAAFPFYSKAAPYDRLQIRCWKKTSAVDLASSGGHEARFENRRVFPIRFLLRHYPIRGKVHGERKVFVDRQPRFRDEERARGWHVQYLQFVDGAPFVQDSSTLTRFDPAGVRIDLSLHHRGVEALEASLADVRAGLEAARADLASTRTELETRTDERERLQQELQRKTEDALALCRRLEQREKEIAAAHDELAERTTQLESVRSELAATASDLAATTTELNARTTELAGLETDLAARTTELAVRTSELTARTNELAARQIEVANLNAAANDVVRQLDAFRQSRTWRWTAPARTVYEWLVRKAKG